MFDIIVDNPPYINVSKVKNKNLLKNKVKINGNIDVGTLSHRGKINSWSLLKNFVFMWLHVAG
jgi:hypothetical protein